MNRRRRWWFLERREEQAQTSGADAGETAEVLLQVVLPIVLILTYCVLQSARNYIEMVGEMRENYRQALIELQKQRIITALETVKKQRRQDLDLSLFSQKEIHLDDSGKWVGAHVDASGQRVSDHVAFVKTCRATAEIFRGEASRAREKARIYQRVLKAAKLTDTGSGTADASFAEQIEVAERGQITDANRLFLNQEIRAFLNDLHEEVVQLELQVMQAALEIYRNKPLEALYRWNPELARLKKAIVQALNQPGGAPGPYEDSLLRALFRKVREDFEKQGYSFLPEIWETI